MSNKQLLAGFIVFVVMFAVFYAYFSSRLFSTGPIELDGVEIREYEGMDLSSVQDFRENSIKGPQYIDNETYTLAITGLVENELEITYDDVISDNQLYKKVVTLHCVEGWSVTLLWEGVLIEDLIEEAGVDPNATTVIFYAYDGYSTAVPLDYIINNDIIIATE